MKKLDFNLSSLEIIQRCLEHFKGDIDFPNNSSKAEIYLNKINRVIDGETVMLTFSDILELHRFVSTIFARRIHNGIINGKWTTNQWERVLANLGEDVDEDYECCELRRKK